MKLKSLVVNAITFARVPLIFAWAVFAVAQELGCGKGLVFAVLACAAMLFSGLTDLWDGKLARKWRVVSTLGKMADPLMDKVFYIVAFPTLLWIVLHRGGEGCGAHALVMLAFTVLYMLRDTWVTFLRSVGAMYGAEVAAMWLGKVRTALSFPGAGWVYVYLVFEPVLPPGTGGENEHLIRAGWLTSCFVVEGFLMALTLWSLVTYTSAYLPYLRKALSGDLAAK